MEAKRRLPVDGSLLIGDGTSELRAAPYSEVVMNRTRSRDRAIYKTCAAQLGRSRQSRAGAGRASSTRSTGYQLLAVPGFDACPQMQHHQTSGRNALLDPRTAHQAPRLKTCSRRVLPSEGARNKCWAYGLTESGRDRCQHFAGNDLCPCPGWPGRVRHQSHG